MYIALSHLFTQVHSPMACSLFQLVLKESPPSLMQACTLRMMLLHAPLAFCSSRESFYCSTVAIKSSRLAELGGGLPRSSATARASSPGATPLQAIAHWWPEGTTTIWAERLASTSCRPLSSRWCEGGHQLVRLVAAGRCRGPPCGTLKIFLPSPRW